jgi:hypothetical protein
MGANVWLRGVMMRVSRVSVQYVRIACSPKGASSEEQRTPTVQSIARLLPSSPPPHQLWT